MNLKSQILTHLNTSSTFEEFEPYSRGLSSTLPQPEMYKLYADILTELSADDAKYDYLADCLDYVCGGPWAKNDEYYESEFGGEQI